MTIGGIIAIICMLTLAQFLLIWFLLYFDISYYTNWGKDVIWVTKNRELNWFFTYFLPPHAIMYEELCERLNGKGLALLLLLLSLVTLPVTLIMSLIGFFILLVRYMWRTFCRAFARKEDNE
jgi:hypothetical protein